MKLTIVIPALNEEEAIGSTIRRCQEAVPHICNASPVTDVNIVVVSDGSTDRTAEIARSFAGVSLIEFEQNQGYGAAIKAGFEAGGGDLLSFLDSDGTCDPLYFGDMCHAMEAERADVVIGSRMGPDSQMPLVRTIGNKVYAMMLGVLARKRVSDTASGMRVIRATSLKSLYPLPDGLHFTPAMSARVLMDDHLRIVEIPMTYSERIGRSKLSVVRDGLRFTLTIADAALVARPSRIILPMLAALLIATFGMMVHPLSRYMEEGHLADWMIYRAVAALLSVTLAMLLLAATAVADEIIDIALPRAPQRTWLQRWIGKLFETRSAIPMVTACVGVAVLLCGKGFWQYFTTGKVYIHWWRVIASSSLLTMACIVGVTWLMLRIMSLLKKRQAVTVATPRRTAAEVSDAPSVVQPV